MSAQALIPPAFLALSCVSLGVQVWALAHLIGNGHNLIDTGLLRTSICRVACAVLYVYVGLNALWFTWAELYIPLVVFGVVQATWQANAVADVQLKRKLTGPKESTVDYAAHAHFSDYAPTDFGWSARDPEADPSLLVPFTYAGVSFGSMHRDVVNLFRALLDELVPLIPGGLVDGQCGCYNPASVTVGGSRSFHTYGIAIDLNWGENPMGATVHPTGPHTLPAAASAIARKYGCEWGGDWTYPQDWMHIEVQLSPADAAGFTPTPAAPPPKPLTVEDEMYTLWQVVVGPGRGQVWAVRPGEAFWASGWEPGHDLYNLQSFGLIANPKPKDWKGTQLIQLQWLAGTFKKEKAS